MHTFTQIEAVQVEGIMEYVVLVDEKDNDVGSAEKMEAHTDPRLHRAFSVFIFDKKGRMLLQRRALSKYHSPGLWTNSCCSHPRPGENSADAAHRRLVEEMGFDTELEEAFHFIYKASFDNGLTEWELDHVFLGNYDGAMKPDPDEVEGIQWIELEELKNDILEDPDNYTAWFKIAFKMVLEHMER